MTDALEETLEGILVRFLFQSEDEDFSVATLRLDRPGGETRIAGALNGLHEGERVRLRGRWRHDSRFGRQFQVSAGYPLLPQDLEGIRKYLASGRVKGVGKGLAERLVAKFGRETLRIVAEDPVLLAEVPGIGPKRSRELVEAFRAQRDQREALVFLQGLGLSGALSRKVFEKYADATIATVRADPYGLVARVRGIGFRTADGIARSLGFAADSPQRAAAGLFHLLGEATDEGHLCLPQAELLTRAARLLGQEAVAPAVLDQLVADHRLIDEDARIWLPALHRAECEAATRVLGLLAAEVDEIKGDPAHVALEIQLAPTQQEALRLALRVPFMVLTGGPGTGKTTIVRALLALLEPPGASPGSSSGAVLLAAPTGRAARRITEATGREARTLHRLLEYTPAEGGFRRDADTPLEASAVIVDEASMIDLPLFLALLRAVAPGTRLILVGDADQLPSVGPGNVLADLLSVPTLPSVRLTEIFRQARQSHIILAAHAVLHGLVPEGPPRGIPSDFFVIQARSGEEAADLVERTVAERIPEAFGIPADEVQVLAPMHRGACGTEALNRRLQDRLNPGETLVKVGERAYRKGDRVMMVRNDYEKEVFNGELGRVLGKLPQGGLAVRFEERVVEFARDALDMLVPAWACTIHKSQGSEYSAVVVPVVGEHYVMLQRTLLYTALTRGRKLVVLVAQPEALRRAVSNGAAGLRFTGLAGRLGASGGATATGLGAPG
jgi:exodeoxyribonuclease V alpha subunit